MAWQTTPDLDEFEAATREFLMAERARNTLQLTLPSVLRRRGLDAYGDQPPLFGWHRDRSGAVDAALIQTPPHPVILTDVPPAALESLVAVLTAAGPARLTGVDAPNPTAEALGTAWHELTGATVAVAKRHRLYRLGELSWPHPLPPGAPRVGTAADREVMTAWYLAFALEIGELSPANVDRLVDDRVGYGGLTLWEVDGEPVAMAGAVRAVAGTVRVAPVYTPPELRGRGYAGAATAAVSRRALDEGAEEVLLFTDLLNPTSNALYQRLGYRAVEDRLGLDFTPPRP